jgi:hypothetical protein
MAKRDYYPDTNNLVFHNLAADCSTQVLVRDRLERVVKHG